MTDAAGGGVLRGASRTLTGSEPLDRPSAARPHRVYVATTNHCNRACPWCSTCSSPRGSTFLSAEDYVASFPAEGPFEVQLEGGEPTVHPRFDELIRLARDNPRCTRVVVVTNGVLLPREPDELRRFVEGLGRPLTLKLSINHHLLTRDAGLIELARLLREVMTEDRLLVLNVRLRRGVRHDDREIVDAVREAGLLQHANVFFLQRYGFAADREGWDEPFLVGTDFSMVNPDGQVFGPDLVARSEAMRRLP